MFEQIFKNIDDVLRKDAGCGTELDYIEQTSWVLFLKYLDDLEVSKDGKWAMHKTIITDIKPISYYEKVLGNLEKEEE